MKIYIICDIEGTAGAVDFLQQCEFEGKWFAQTRRLATLELNAAVEGALAGGATEIYAWDGHGNFPGGLDYELVHPSCNLILHAGDGGPAMLDSSFDAVFMVGLHGMAFAEKGVCAHSFATHIAGTWVNGQPFGEIGMNIHTAGQTGVPCVFISGDRAAAREAQALVPELETAVVKEGLGEWPGSGLSFVKNGYTLVRSLQGLPMLSESPEKARQTIREAAQRAMKKIGQVAPFCYPGPYTLRTQFVEVRWAERAAQSITGARRVDETTIELENSPWMYPVM